VRRRSSSIFRSRAPSEAFPVSASRGVVLTPFQCGSEILCALSSDGRRSTASAAVGRLRQVAQVSLCFRLRSLPTNWPQSLRTRSVVTIECRGIRLGAHGHHPLIEAGPI
jgi:hypothetical protein